MQLVTHALFGGVLSCDNGAAGNAGICVLACAQDLLGKLTGPKAN